MKENLNTESCKPISKQQQAAVYEDKIEKKVLVLKELVQ